jgi:hypothetical protein
MPPDQLADYGAGVQIHIEDLTANITGNERRGMRSRERWEALLPAASVSA